MLESVGGANLAPGSVGKKKNVAGDSSSTLSSVIIEGGAIGLGLGRDKSPTPKMKGKQDDDGG